MMRRALAQIMALVAVASALVPPGAKPATPAPPAVGSASTKLVPKPVENKKKERRRIMSSPDFLRNNGDFKAEKAAVEAKMLAEMKSSLLDDMRATSYETTRGEGTAAVTFRLAHESAAGVPPPPLARASNGGA